MRFKSATTMLICLTPLLVAGCADRAKEEATTTSISRAQITADRAQGSAAEALNAANAARASADQARATADRALQAAQQAQASAQAANDKADRMYQRGLRK